MTQKPLYYTIGAVGGSKSDAELDQVLWMAICTLILHMKNPCDLTSFYFLFSHLANFSLIKSKERSSKSQIS
jgi:hypothetical protein